MRDYLAPTTLETVERRFTELTADPAPLTLDFTGTACGLPDGPVRLDDLRVTMLKPQTGRHAKDAVWSKLVRRAQDVGEPWITAAIGMAMPALKKIAGDTARYFHGDISDLDSEIVEGFLHALNQADPNAPMIYSSLRFMARRYGQEARLSADRAAGRTGQFDDAVSARYRRGQGGHPDLVLANAVRAKGLSAEDADLIMRAHLDGQDRVSLAEDHGMSPYQCRKRLSRAEERLRSYLASSLPMSAA